MKFPAILVLTYCMLGIPAGAEDVANNKPIKIEQAAEMIAAGVQLLDVRTKEEWDEGHLKNAKLVTLSDDGFAEKVKATLDPKKPVVVHCRSGARSAKAVKLLRDAGFTTVYDMAGGIIAWEKQGKPVEKIR